MEEVDDCNRSPPRRKRGRPRIYGFDELNPGDSFLIPGKRRDDIAPCLYAAQRRTGFRFRACNVSTGVIVTRPSWDPGGWTPSSIKPRRPRISRRRGAEQ